LTVAVVRLDAAFAVMRPVADDVPAIGMFDQIVEGVVDPDLGVAGGIDLRAWINAELTAVRLGSNTFDEAALELIERNALGNLRLARNLSHASLLHACRDSKRQVSISHVNEVLIQPHWRSHEQLIKSQIA
jgi:hypothetical protein